MKIYFEIHFDIQLDDYIIKNLGNSTKTINSQFGYEINYLNKDEESYCVRADLKYDDFGSGELNKIITNVKKTYLRKKKIENIINKLYITK